MVTDDFSPIQMHIVTSRISGLSYSRIRWEERPMYNRQISKCLKYSSLRLTWELEHKSGNLPYLCRADSKLLIDGAIDAL